MFMTHLPTGTLTWPITPSGSAERIFPFFTFTRIGSPQSRQAESI